MSVWYCGLDLGQASDPTALAVMERSDGARYLMRQLHRFPLDMSYTAQVDAVCAWMKTPVLLNCSLVIDHTGVGRAVVDLFKVKRPPVRIIPVTITGGRQLTATRQKGQGFNVPKADLVAALQVVIQQRRFSFSAGLPLAQVLMDEMANFRVKVTEAANETFGNWRDSDHDDTVLAACLAVWWGEQHARYTQVIQNISERPMTFRDVGKSSTEPSPVSPSSVQPSVPRRIGIVEQLTGKRPDEFFRRTPWEVGGDD